MRGAIPSGCRLMRITFAGGASSSGATPSVSTATLRLAATMFQPRSTTTAGYGSCPRSTRSSASRTGAISGSSSARCPYTGA